jgi:Domain of unknown function (DUF4394)
MKSLSTASISRFAALATPLALAACVSMEPPEGPPRKETVLAAMATGELIRFNAGQPSRVLSRVAVRGLDNSDRLVGIDFRVARGVLYALSARGRLYTLDTVSGQLTAVGSGVALPADATCACIQTAARSPPKTRRCVTPTAMWQRARRRALAPPPTPTTRATPS